jgi:hypothetical protein
MAWTTPGTATAGEVLTAAFWNANVRDNSNHLYQNTAQLIETITRGSGGAITFSSIPQTYTSLEIFMLVRADVATTAQAVGVRFNGDSGSNYRYIQIQVNNATVSGGSSAAANNIEVMVLPGTTAAANVFGAARIQIPFYRSAVNKSVVGEGSCASATLGDAYHRSGSGFWNNTAAITSISFSSNFATGSSATLIGIP